MLKKISHKIVQKMNDVFPRSEEDKQKMEYFLEIILDQTLIMIVVLIICACVGYHREAIVCFLGCMVYRFFAGGIHFKKRRVCILATSLVAVVGGFLIFKISIPFILCLILLLTDFLISLYFAPQVTKDNPITEKYRKIRKIETVILVGIYLLVLFLAKGIWGQGLTVGATLGAISILPGLMRTTE